jgi:hypothetical protein
MSKPVTNQKMSKACHYQTLAYGMLSLISRVPSGSTEKEYASHVGQENLSDSSGFDGSHAGGDGDDSPKRHGLMGILEREFRVWRSRKSRLKAFGRNPIQEAGQAAV